MERASTQALSIQDTHKSTCGAGCSVPHTVQAADPPERQAGSICRAGQSARGEPRKHSLGSSIQSSNCYKPSNFTLTAFPRQRQQSIYGTGKSLGCLVRHLACRNFASDRATSRARHHFKYISILQIFLYLDRRKQPVSLLRVGGIACPARGLL